MLPFWRDHGDRDFVPVRSPVAARMDASRALYKLRRHIARHIEEFGAG
jgi:hypothetical protein